MKPIGTVIVESGMSFNDYQAKSRETAIYPNVGSNYIYPVLGLCGETGEVAEKIKKILRDHRGTFSVEDLAEIKKELGDCLWYLAQISSELHLSFGQVAEENIQKLQSRKDRQTLQGSGDNR